jgi:hypothetical protein
MHRSSSGGPFLACRLFLAAIAGGAVLGPATGCGGPVVVSLQLQAAIDPATREPHDTRALTSLTITLVAGARRDEISIVLDPEQQVALEGITVEKDDPLSVDVWGCEDPETCGKANVVFRGCTDEPHDLSNVEGAYPIVIRMAPVAAAPCPSL